MKRKSDNRTAAKAPAEPRQKIKVTDSGMAKGFLIDGRFECLDATVRPEPGESYAAIDNQSGQNVVVRIIKGMVPDEHQQKDFFACIERLVRMSCSNVEKVLDAGLTPEGHPFVVTEQIDGKAIAAMIADGVAFSITDTCDICRQIARALIEAGRSGCAHGHLSTSTVMLVNDDDTVGRELKVKVTGFAPWNVTPAVVQDYALAPEVILGAAPDIRSDCYSLGVILYTLACGQAPFPGNTKESVALAHLNDKAELPSRASPDRNIPPALDNLLLRLLDKNPEKRQTSPEKILVHLEGIYNLQKAPTIDPVEEIVVARKAPQETSLIDEGISFASGERISTTDFPAISLSDVLTNAAKTKKLGQVTPPEVPDSVEILPVQVAAPPPASQLVPAEVKSSSEKGISPVLVAVATILVIGLVAFSGWYLLNQNAELKRVIEASQKAAAESSQTTTHVAPAPARAEQVNTQPVPAPVPTPAPAPAPTPVDAAPADGASVVQAGTATPVKTEPAEPRPVQAPAEAVQPAPATAPLVAEKPAPTVKEAAPVPAPAKPAPAKAAKAANTKDSTAKKADPTPKKATMPVTRQLEPAEVPPGKPVNKARMVDWNTGIDEDAAPAQKKQAPAPVPEAKKQKPADKKSSGDTKAPADKKPSLNWDD